MQISSSITLSLKVYNANLGPSLSILLASLLKCQDRVALLATMLCPSASAEVLKRLMRIYRQHRLAESQ